MSQAGRDPRAVAAALISDPRMIEACGSHDVGTIIQLMRSRGASIQGLARAADLSVGRLYEYQTGERSPSGFHVFERISDGFRIPGRYLRLADRPWEREDPTLAPAVPDALEEWVASRTVEAMSHFTKMDLILGRREATTQAIATLAVGPSLIECVERWLTPAANGLLQGRPAGNVGLADVERIEQTAQLFRDWSYYIGGGLQRQAVVGQLNGVADLLRDSHPAEVTRRLFGVMSQLAETAGMMCGDSGQAAMAQRYLILALRAAKEAGDYGFGAQILGRIANDFLHRNGPGGADARPADALELIRLAQEGARGQATPALRAFLYTREARAYAHLGRVQAFRRATGRAEDAVASADPAREPDWIRYFTRAEVAGMTGGSLLVLAEVRPDEPTWAREASGVNEHAIRQALPENKRSLAIDRAVLAESYFMQSELEAGVAAGQRAIEVARQTQSDRVRVSLARLYRVSVPYKREPVVREFSDRLAETLAA